MRTAIFGVAVLIAGLAVFSTRPSRAAEPASAATPAKAATEQLPLAFRAVGGDASQVVAQSEAERIRGQWWISLPMQAGHIFFYGTGSGFRLHLMTQSESYEGRWVALRITIGR